MCGVQLNRKIDYLGEFLNALVTVVHGYMLADVLLVGWSRTQVPTIRCILPIYLGYYGTLLRW